MSAVTMRFEDGEFDVQFDAKTCNADALVAVVKDAGFEASAK